jgi:hypothetical protein
MKSRTILLSIMLIMLAGIAVANGDCNNVDNGVTDWGAAWGFNWHLDEHGAWLPLDTNTGHFSTTAPTYTQSPIKIRDEMPTKVYTQPHSSTTRR